MRRVLLVLSLCFCSIAAAQVEKEDAEREKALRDKAAAEQADTSALGWKHSVVTGVNLTQLSFTNWASGGENSLAYTLWLGGRSMRKGEQWDWMNSYRFMFGQARLSSQDLRKTDDEIFLESLLLYKLGVHLNPYASLTFRTQFAPGFKYEQDGTRAQVSRFADPAYVTQSVGMAYIPIPEVITRVGIGAREIITSSYPVYADDPKTSKIEQTRIVGGAEWVTDVNWEFYENMKFISKLEIFSPFPTPDKMTVRWDNNISAKVNKYVNVLLGVQVFYDEVVVPRTQVKEGISIGLSYSLM